MKLVRNHSLLLLAGLALTTILSGCGASQGASGSIIDQASNDTNNATKLDNFITGSISAHVEVQSNNSLTSQDQQNIQEINSTNISVNEEVKRYKDPTTTRYLVLGSSQYDVGIKQTTTPVSEYSYTKDGKNFVVDIDENGKWQSSKRADGQLAIPMADGADIYQLEQYAKGAHFQNKNGQYIAEVKVKPSDFIPLFKELIPVSSLQNADLSKGTYTLHIGVSKGDFGWEFTLFQVDAVLPLTIGAQKQGVTGNWYVNLTERPAVETSMNFVIPAGAPSA